MSLQILKDLKGLRVLVIHPLDAEGKSVVDHLKRIGCQVDSQWPVPESAGSADIVLLTIEQECRDAIQKFLGNLGEMPPAIVSMVSYENPSTLQLVLETDALAVIERPVRLFGLLTNLIVARSLWLERVENKRRLAKLERRLAGIRSLQKAKSVLMESQGLSEESAYEVIRRQAMAKRVSMEEIASAIIHAHDVLNFDGKRA
jgi:AmiR/NasT family two-component response regulator